MLRIINFLKPNNSLANAAVRNYGKHNKKYLYKDGKKFDLIHYYPRNDFVKDPEFEPAKLFRVTRIKPVKGNPHWEKRILRDLGLFEDHSVAVVKNIPENNARLWKIKHLVRIVPITFPYGEPTAEDINYTYLKENGQCFVVKNIGTLEKRLEAAEEFGKKEKEFTGEDLRKDSRLKWLNPWE